MGLGWFGTSLSTKDNSSSRAILFAGALATVVASEAQGPTAVRTLAYISDVRDWGPWLLVLPEVGRLIVAADHSVNVLQNRDAKPWNF